MSSDEKSSEENTLSNMLNRAFAGQDQAWEVFTKRVETGNGEKALRNEEMFLFHLFETQPHEVIHQNVQVAALFEENKVSSLKVFFHLASYHVRAGAFETALEWYEKALFLDESLPAIYTNRAGVYSHLGRYDEALIDLNHSLRLSPSHVPALINKGVVLGQMSRHKEAIDVYSSVIELIPEEAIGYEYRGNNLAMIDSTIEAIADFTRAIECAPKEASLYAKRALCYQDLSDFSNALKDAEAAYRLDSNNPDHANLVRHLKWIAANDSALPDINQDTSDKNPSLPHEAYLNLGIQAMKEGRLHDAITNLRHALRIRPDLILAATTLIGIYINQEKLDEAETICKLMLRNNPESPEVHLMAGNFYHEAEQTQLALEMFSKAIELDPGHGAAYFYRSLLHIYRTNNYTLALTDLDQAIDLGCAEAIKENDEIRRTILMQLGVLFLKTETDENRERFATQHHELLGMDIYIAVKMLIDHMPGSERNSLQQHLGWLGKKIYGDDIPDYLLNL